MHIEQVDVIQLHTLQHRVDGFQRLALAVFGRPKLAGNPYFLARNTALFYGTAYALLIVIGVSRIDMPIAGAQGRETGLLANLVGGLEERSQSELRHEDAIIQLYHRNTCGSFVNVLRERGAAYH